ncbi:MAG: helix-turn-helix transcriptional regulator [Lachnospiraceae bacterium]|nr:helix-turn-helix transcriptional regulator [Lachnospiraceae bacterium]
MAGTISSDVIRGYNDTMILHILKQAPSYGYEISKRIRAVTEEKYVIKETTLYSAFARMEKNGHIESYEADDSGGGRKRTWYRITDAGKTYYREKCEEWELTRDVVQRFIEGSVAIEDKGKEI